MPREARRAVLADSGFWIAVADARDPQHGRATGLLGALRRHVVLVPWPATYEVLSTRMTRRPECLHVLSRAWGERVRTVDDAPYRERCLSEALREPERPSPRSLSLVDRVIRAMLVDSPVRAHSLLTFNARDFQDVCGRLGVSIWPDLRA